MKQSAQPHDTTPVLVGVGQFMQRTGALDEALSPMGIAAEAARVALADTGLGGIVADAIDTVVAIRIFPDSWNRPRAPNPHGRATNPPRAIARRLGVNPSLAIYGNVGGNTPQKYINEMAGRIADGELNAVLLAGGEALKTAQAALREEQVLDWNEEDSGSLEDRGIGEVLSTSHELAHGLGVPIQTYPLFENALRHQQGHSLHQHLQHMACMMQPFNRVASSNPFATYGTPRSAEELASVSAENRFICLPYPKWMNAMDGVNQGAAVILTSVGKARELGIHPAKWVFLHGCSQANENLLVSERRDYTSSPALGLNTRQALEMAGKSIADMSLFDLYSCFPSAVGIACKELGLSTDDPRGLTVTGGLPFFGGPGNNYSLHAIASMAECLRKDRNKFGLVTANGGYLTKHASGVYSCTPVKGKWQLPSFAAIQREVDGLEYPAFTETPEGRASIETYTVCFRRGEPDRGIVVGRLLETQQRFLANTAPDPRLLVQFIEQDPIGMPGRVNRQGSLNRFQPGT